MFRLIGFLVVVAGSFSLGFFVGQHNIHETKQAVVNLSRYALEQALSLGGNRHVEWQERILEAKSNLLQAKSELIDRNYGKAKEELERALHSLKKATASGEDPLERQKAEKVSKKLQQTHHQMDNGDKVTRTTLDDLQKELDALLPD